MILQFHLDRSKCHFKVNLGQTCENEYLKFSVNKLFYSIMATACINITVYMKCVYLYNVYSWFIKAMLVCDY